MDANKQGLILWAVMSLSYILSGIWMLDIAETPRERGIAEGTILAGILGSIALIVHFLISN